ncbi:MAG: hypothetical protein ACRC8Y_16000 [Chroococcales cyanobacterium]
MNKTIEEVIKQLQTMPQSLQERVLEFARMLGNTEIQGTPGEDLLRFAGCIPHYDLLLMKDAIEQDCERVDINEW